ncbi:MAG: hypothetical protein Q4D30_06150 [Bacteroidales bacterium]|nr:hypothetical protein [Bacteroidales bacterium]
MRKIVFFMMLLMLSARFGYAQEVNTTSTSDSRFVYWEDPNDDNSRVMKKSLFKDNWFIGFHLGGVYNWGSNYEHANVLRSIRPIGGISLGKWFSPYVGFRAQVTLAGNRGTTALHTHPTWMAGAAYGDALFNLTNLLGGFKEARKFNLNAILGIGGERTFNYDGLPSPNPGSHGTNIRDWYLSGRVGLQALFRISKVWDFSLEATNSWMNNAYDGTFGTNTTDPHLNVMAGFVYRFKNHDGSHDFSYAMRDSERFALMNEEINRLRQKAIDDKAFAEAHPNITVVNSQQVNTLISFVDGSAEIDELQQVNVYTTAEALKRVSDADLYITVLGHQSNDANLFMQRANNIRTSLMNDYGIAAGRIYMEKDPAVVEALDKTRNCVIMYINE